MIDLSRFRVEMGDGGSITIVDATDSRSFPRYWRRGTVYLHATLSAMHRGWGDVYSSVMFDANVQSLTVAPGRGGPGGVLGGGIFVASLSGVRHGALRSVTFEPLASFLDEWELRRNLRTDRANVRNGANAGFPSLDDGDFGSGVLLGAADDSDEVDCAAGVPDHVIAEWCDDFRHGLTVDVWLEGTAGFYALEASELDKPREIVLAPGEMVGLHFQNVTSTSGFARSEQPG